MYMQAELSYTPGSLLAYYDIRQELFLAGVSTTGTGILDAILLAYTFKPLDRIITELGD